MVASLPSPCFALSPPPTSYSILSSNHPTCPRSSNTSSVSLSLSNPPTPSSSSSSSSSASSRSFPRPRPRRPAAPYQTASIAGGTPGFDHGDLGSGPGSGSGSGGRGRGRGRGNNGGNGDNDENNNSNGDGNDSSSSLFSRLVAVYAHSLATRPLATKTLTATLIAVFSDATAQRLQTGSWSPARALPFALASAAVTGPLYHLSFGLLERALPATCARNVVAQVAADQLLCAPLWIVLFTAASAAFEAATSDAATKVAAATTPSTSTSPPGSASGSGGGGGDVPWFDDTQRSSLRQTTNSRLRKEFWPLLKLTWSLYPVLQCINIALVPLQWRVAVLNGADLLFTVGLSMITHPHPSSAPPVAVATSSTPE